MFFLVIWKLKKSPCLNELKEISINYKVAERVELAYQHNCILLTLGVYTDLPCAKVQIKRNWFGESFRSEFRSFSTLFALAVLGMVSHNFFFAHELRRTYIIQGDLLKKRGFKMCKGTAGCKEHNTSCIIRSKNKNKRLFHRLMRKCNNTRSTYWAWLV